MKARTPAKGYTPGTLADPAFKYRKSYDTDIRRTIARAQREQARASCLNMSPWRCSATRNPSSSSRRSPSPSAGMCMPPMATG